MAEMIRRTRTKAAGNADAVLRVLRKARRPIGAYDIIASLRPKLELVPPTVYRALDRLIAAGLAHKIESLNAFVACCHGAHQIGAAFAICDSCGNVTEFEAPAVDGSLAAWSRTAGFAPGAASIELHGTCAACLRG